MEKKGDREEGLGEIPLPASPKKWMGATAPETIPKKNIVNPGVEKAVSDQSLGSEDSGSVTTESEKPNTPKKKKSKKISHKGKEEKGEEKKMKKKKIWIQIGGRKIKAEIYAERK